MLYHAGVLPPSGSCHQQRHDKENGRCAQGARTALFASYALATDF